MSRRDSYTPEADGVGFDPGTTDLVSDNAGDAIREVFETAQGTSRGYTFVQYNGNANSGRWLEFFSGIASDDAPLYTPDPLEVLTIVARTTATSATCTIGWYDISGGIPGTLLHTTTFTANKQIVETGIPIFSVPQDAEIALKIDSGSITKPHIYFILKGG